MKVLIAEDNKNLADVMGMGLRLEGMEATVTYDGRDTLSELDSNHYDVLILDRDLPGVHGDEIARGLRQRHNHIYILMVTAASQTDDVVGGLRLGADDYLTKPFEYRELVARLGAIERRLGLKHVPVFEKGGFRADFRTGEIIANGRRLRFGRKELATLRMLLEAEGAPVDTERLAREIWHTDTDDAKNLIKATIYTLRGKIGVPDLIETVAGQGYRIP